MAEVRDFTDYAKKLNNGVDYEQSPVKSASYKEKYVITSYVFFLEQ